MKKLTRNYIRRLISEELTKTNLGLILEEEDIFGGDDEGGDEEPAEEEAAEEDTGDDSAEEDGDEGEEEGGEEGEEGDEEGDDAASTSPDPADATGPEGFELDNEINAVMADFEAEALQIAAAQQESKNNSLKKILLEVDEEEIPIDVDNFAGNVARLISNYANLIDMEQVIFNKSKDFLEDKYGVEAVQQLEDILATRYDIEFDHEYDPEKEEQSSYAVGAAVAPA